MRARILSIDSAEHVAAQELLPWLVNGTLGASEADSVRRHVAQCDRCQKDAAEQAELRAVALPEEIGTGVDRHWAALRDRLDAVPRVPAKVFDVLRARRWQRWLWTTVAIQAVLVLALALVLIGVPLGDESYRALGSAPPSLEPNAVAVFSSDATNQQMRQALRAAGATIVAGPTVTDGYLLRLKAVRPDVLDRLRAQPGVVSAEALQGERAR